MDTHSTPPGDGPSAGGSLFDSMRRRRQAAGPAPFIVGGVVLVALLGGGVWWWTTKDSGPAPAETVALPPLPPRDTTAAAPAPAEEPLPPLSASDAFVRRVVAALSAHPQLAQWLATDDLIERFVDAVVSVAGGHSPSAHVEFLLPERPMSVQPAGDGLVVAPASYARYDLFTAVLTSLDTAGSAELYRRLHPLFVEAYGALGIEGGNWDATFARAVQNLLAARIPTGPIRVRGEAGWYQFEDPQLEALTPAEKHILRLGPQHGPAVQAKIREISQAIGI